MNAPGDSALIVVLLAVFVACSAYAAGRVHQRWEAAKDREEAYRDGYENGTSNVFSTAVRMLGPKRSVRAAAPVTTASKPDPEPASEATVPVTPPVAPKKPEKSDSSPPTTGLPALGFPAPQPPPRYAISEPSAVGGVIYQQLRDPRTTDGKSPLMGERPTMPPLPHPRVADRPRMAAVNEPANLDELGHPEQPEVIKIRKGRGGSDERRERRDNAHPPANLDELGREGGGGERSEEGGGGDTAMAADAAAPVRRRRGGHRAKQPEDETTVNQAAEAQPDVPTGRHTVPDELVRATTYRLPPDRVFRAKVRDGTPLPDEPTTRLPSVPKPRDES